MSEPNPKNPGRKPDYILVLKSKKGHAPVTKAGVAWVHRYGAIDIHLGPGVTIKSGEDYYINLKPYTKHDVELQSTQDPEPSDDEAQNA